MTSVIRTARAILGGISSLTGTRASGTVLVTAGGGDVGLPRNRYALPVIDGQQRPDLAAKVDEGPNDDKSWTVTSSGTSVSMFSNMGGIRQNLPGDTVLAFDPPISGIKSAVVTVPFTGGANASGFGALKDAAMVEHLGTLPVDLSRSSIKGFPCALLAWSDDEPADSSTTSMMSPRSSRLGTRKNLYKITYQLSVISERSESDHARRAYGIEILDQIAELLVDRNTVDGEHISNPSGLQIVRRWRETGGGPAYQKYYVYAMLVSAMVTFRREDTRSYNTWALTVLNVDKQTTGEDNLRLVEDVEIDMT